MAISQEIRLADVPALGVALAGFGGAALALFVGDAVWLNGFMIAGAGLVALLCLFFAANRKIAVLGVFVAFALLIGLRGSNQIARDERAAMVGMADDTSRVDLLGAVAWIESGNSSSAVANLWIEDVRLARDEEAIQLTHLRIRLAVPLRDAIGISIGDVIACNARLSADAVSPGTLHELSWSLEHQLAGRAKLADPGSLVVVQGEESLRRIIFDIRANLLAILEQQLKPDARAVAGALLLGERSTFSPEFKSELQITGLAHLFALSGLNTGLLVSLFWLGFSWLRVPRRLRYVLLLLLLVVYAALGLGAPSLIRSSIMAGMVILGRLLHRQAHPVNLLLLAAGIELAIWPLHVLDLGFHLSYLSLAGILAAYSTLKQPLQDLLRTPSRSFRAHLVEILGSTVGAQIATAPVVALTFGRVSGLAILANIVAIPLFSVLLVLVVVLLLLDPLSYEIAAICGRSIEGLVALFAQLTSISSSLIGASLRLPLVWYAAVIVMLAQLTAIIAALRGRQLTALALVLIGLNVAIWSPMLENQPLAECVAMDNSDSASLFVRVGECSAVIGCSPDFRQERTANQLEREMERSRLQKTDFLLLPSLAADEIGGAAAVVPAARPTIALRFDEVRHTQTFALLEAACLERGTTIEKPEVGQRWRTGSCDAILSKFAAARDVADWEFRIEIQDECSVVLSSQSYPEDSTARVHVDGSELYVYDSSTGIRGARWKFEANRWQRIESSGQRAARLWSIPMRVERA